jgi:hypothetical protein
MWRVLPVLGTARSNGPAIADDLLDAAAQLGARHWQNLLLTDSKELYVVTIDFDGSASSVKIERIDLTADGIRLSYTETHEGKEGVRAVFIWRVDAEPERRPLEFRAHGQYQRGELSARDSDKPTLAFGWQLAEATGSAPQSR